MGKTRGFTLIELMVTIAVLAVIAAMAVPSFSTITRKNQLMNDAYDFENTLKELRSTALLRQRDQSLSLDSSVTGAWQPKKEIKWNPIPVTTVAYNMLGLLKSPTNLCFILEHKKDSQLKAVIIARKSGLVFYDKSRTNCSSLGDD